MQPSPKAEAFQSGVRRKIGKACAREACTLAELARRLRRPTQGLNSVVNGMLDEGLLVKQGAGRGATYLLAPDRVSELEAATAEAAKPGLLRLGQRLLVIDGPDIVGLAAVLADKRFRDHVAWISRVDGDGRWLVALDEAPDGLVSDELEAELQRSGGISTHLRIDVLMAPEDVRRYLNTIRA